MCVFCKQGAEDAGYRLQLKGFEKISNPVMVTVVVSHEGFILQTTSTSAFAATVPKTILSSISLDTDT